MPRSPQADVLRHSVTKDDYRKDPRAGYSGIYQLTVPYSGGAGDLPPYWSPYRDRVLKTSPMREAMWASAIGIATSKVASADWRLEGTKVTYWNKLLNAADGNQSFVSFQEKQIRDYLLTDNGAFFELVHVSNARGSRLLGITHLPSWRCIRTPSPDVPVIYMDRMGDWHEMKDYQVVTLADEVDGDNLFYGTGHCAAARAWPAIAKLSALELYVYEKISGKRPSRIYLVNANLNDKQLQAAINAGEERANQKGYVMYMDAIMVPILDPGANASVAAIDLKGLPENFSPEEERIHAMLTYANAIGIDPVELDPNLAARGRALGSGSQAQVLDDKQSTKGLISYHKKVEYLYNEYILPDRVSFFLGVNDIVDATRRAGIAKVRSESVRVLVGNGSEPPIITPEQAKQVLADAGDIPAEFLAADLTSTEMLRDNEKPALVLDVEHQKPIDAKLMQTKPKPEPTLAKPAAKKPTGNGKAKESYLDYLAQKEYERQVNAAEKWVSTINPNYWMLTDTELLELHQTNGAPVG